MMIEATMTIVARHPIQVLLCGTVAIHLLRDALRHLACRPKALALRQPVEMPAARQAA
ncbi:MAG: hypothetical protein AB1689_09565 [Thermodesulfobacteriota bacterium]